MPTFSSFYGILHEDSMAILICHLHRYVRWVEESLSIYRVTLFIVIVECLCLAHFNIRHDRSYEFQKSTFLQKESLVAHTNDFEATSQGRKDSKNKNKN